LQSKGSKHTPAPQKNSNYGGKQSGTSFFQKKEKVNRCSPKITKPS
jgi:hypothetical protein